MPPDPRPNLKLVAGVTLTKRSGDKVVFGPSIIETKEGAVPRVLFALEEPTLMLRFPDK